jgi:hypothetical protein
MEHDIAILGLHGDEEPCRPVDPGNHLTESTFERRHAIRWRLERALGGYALAQIHAAAHEPHREEHDHEYRSEDARRARETEADGERCAQRREHGIVGGQDLHESGHDHDRRKCEERGQDEDAAGRSAGVALAGPPRQPGAEREHAGGERKEHVELDRPRDLCALDGNVHEGARDLDHGARKIGPRGAQVGDGRVAALEAVRQEPSNARMRGRPDRDQSGVEAHRRNGGTHGPAAGDRADERDRGHQCDRGFLGEKRQRGREESERRSSG